jgi:hypothetical protein
LIQTRLFNREAWQARKEKQELQSLIRLTADGKEKIQIADAQLVKLIELYDKHGAPGFFPTPEMRSDYEKIKAKPQQPPKAKRGRGA